MKTIVWLFKFVLKGAIFFTLFAFALNNQADATVHFFFGYQWTAPMVLVILAVFAAGLMIGVLGMVPRWWRQRRNAAKARAVANALPPQRAEPESTGPVPPPHGL